jgi:hypothetical protein
MKKHPLEWTQHLCATDFERKKLYALAYIKATFRPTKDTWLDCYHVKQKITERVGYFFAQDMAKYFALEGYEIGLDEAGRYRVRAAYQADDEEPRPTLFFAGRGEMCPGFTEATRENP